MPMTRLMYTVLLSFGRRYTTRSPRATRGRSRVTTYSLTSSVGAIEVDGMLNLRMLKMSARAGPPPATRPRAATASAVTAGDHSVMPRDFGRQIGTAGGFPGTITAFIGRTVCRFERGGQER